MNGASLVNHIGKRITAIGFGNSDGTTHQVYACLDTSNYNLYVESGILNIVRKDVFYTDGYFYCPSKLVNAPIHLIDEFPTESDNQFLDCYYFAVPVSVGLGTTFVRMNEEYTILPYENHIEQGQRMFTILEELSVDYFDNGLYPSNELYPDDGLYPARPITTGVYPSEDVYPEDDIYPLSVPYLWYMIKYEIYRAVTDYANVHKYYEDTGEYYYISVLINGLKKIKSNIIFEGK